MKISLHQTYILIHLWILLLKNNYNSYCTIITFFERGIKEIKSLWNMYFFIRDTITDWYVKILFFIWTAINANIGLVIDFYVYRQKGTLFTNHSSFMPEYLVMIVCGFLVFIIYSRRKESIVLEILCILFMISIGFIISDWKQSYAEYAILNEELKVMCYKTIRILVSTSQFLWIPIWFGTRIIKQYPIEWGPEVPLGMLGVFSFRLFGSIALDILTGRL